MDRQTAIERLLEHYQNPRNHGPLDGASVVMPGGNPGCGDLVTIYLKVDADGGTVERVTFEGRGCTVSQAAASILTELAIGRSLDELAMMDDTALIDLLGREAVGTRPRCATLALNTLKVAIRKYRDDQRRADAG